MRLDYSREVLGSDLILPSPTGHQGSGSPALSFSAQAGCCLAF